MSFCGEGLFPASLIDVADKMLNAGHGMAGEIPHNIHQGSKTGVQSR
jgi:hypothetical protein